MKLITKIISAIRPLRFLFTAFISTILFVSTVAPAQAGMMSSKSKLTDATTQLNKIDDKAQKAIDKPAMNLTEIEKRSQNGLNEVQGSADKNKMYTSNSSEPAIGKDIEKALKKITN